MRSPFYDNELERITDRSPLAQRLWEWRKQMELTEQANISDDLISREIGISRAVWSRVIRSKHGSLTSPQTLSALSEFFSRYFGEEASLENIQALAGYVTCTALAQFVEHNRHKFDDPDRILALLQKTQTLEWRSSYSAEKQQADKILQGSQPEEEKAHQIADAIGRWHRHQARVTKEE